MKKVLLSSLVVMLVAGFAGPAFAHNDDKEDTSIRKAEIRLVAEERKVEKKLTKDLTKEQKRMQEIQKFWTKMKQRLGVLIRAQEKLASRIENKLNRMAEKGQDVTAQRAKLVVARQQIATAKTALANGDATVTAALAGTDPKVAFERVRALTNDILTKIKAAHQALNSVIANNTQKNEDRKENKDDDDDDDDKKRKSPSPSPLRRISPLPTVTILP